MKDLGESKCLVGLLNVHSEIMARLLIKSAFSMDNKLEPQGWRFQWWMEY